MIGIVGDQRPGLGVVHVQTFLDGFQFELLGGFRASTLGWTSTEPTYMGVTDGTTTHKWFSTGSYIETFGSNFSLGMPSVLPSGEQLSSAAVVGGRPQYVLFSSTDRSSAVFSGVVGYNIGDKYVIGFEDLRDGDRDYQDVVVIATAVAVPEPASIALLATGMLGLLIVGASKGRRQG